MMSRSVLSNWLPRGRKAPPTFVAFVWYKFLWCKYFHHGWFKALNCLAAKFLKNLVIGSRELGLGSC